MQKPNNSVSYSKGFIVFVYKLTKKINKNVLNYKTILQLSRNLIDVSICFHNNKSHWCIMQSEKLFQLSSKTKSFIFLGLVKNKSFQNE